MERVKRGARRKIEVEEGTVMWQLRSVMSLLRNITESLGGCTKFDSLERDARTKAGRDER